ncbi:MAG: flagellar basal body L-ring protein FlgH [Rickettsiaceae bacterium]|nr:flagellar basal body L-ring protein FlgH [Rickettsiaceae bacterium]
MSKNFRKTKICDTKNQGLRNKPIKRAWQILSIFLVSHAQTSCTDSLEKISRLGKAPDLARLEIPQTQGDDLDPAKVHQMNEIRKKQTNSLWQPGAMSFFRDNRAWKIGDIVKVIINISDSAQLNNSTNNSRTAKESIAIPSVFGKEKAIAKALSGSGDPTNLLSTDSSKNHQGTGTINRKEAIQTVISAVVSQILSNGNLVIQGKQEIRVNHELREVKVTGIIRPRDISSENSVNSDQIAEARISYGGRGVVSDVQQPKIGSQVVDIIAPF